MADPTNLDQGQAWRGHDGNPECGAPGCTRLAYYRQQSLECVGQISVRQFADAAEETSRQAGFMISINEASTSQ